MIPRGTIPALLPGIIVIVLLAGLLSWGNRGHRDADRQRTRADSLATEIAAAEVRELGYQTALASATTERDLKRHLSDSLAAVLTSYGARPTTVATVRVSAAGSAVAPAHTVDDAASVWAARIVDGPLTLDAVVDHPARRLGVRWELLIEGALVHSVAADGRLLVAARSTDPRVVLEVPELAWSPPPPPPGPSRLRWLLAGIGVGVIGWELVR